MVPSLPDSPMACIYPPCTGRVPAPKALTKLSRNWYCNEKSCGGLKEPGSAHGVPPWPPSRPRPELRPAPAPLTAATVRGWQAQRAGVDRRLALFFRWSEVRQRAGAYMDGLLSDATPYGFQHLPGRAVWSADQARDALYAYVAEYLGDPEGVVVVDETGFPKQGTHSAGMGRQYCGTLGKVGNCQVGGFLAYVGARGHTLLDRELYLPEAWTDDPARLQEAGLAPTRPSRPSRSWPGACSVPWSVFARCVPLKSSRNCSLPCPERGSLLVVVWDWGETGFGCRTARRSRPCLRAVSMRLRTWAKRSATVRCPGSSSAA